MTTATDWRTLAPGRELDAIVAERVFGEVAANAPCGDSLTRTGTSYAPTMAEANYKIRAGYANAVARGMKLWPAEYVGPRYSGDIAAAWLVVAEMARRGYSVSLRCEEPGGPWSCSLWDARGYRHVADEIHIGPAPHAIVRAALAYCDSETRGEG